MIVSPTLIWPSCFCRSGSTTSTVRIAPPDRSTIETVCATGSTPTDEPGQDHLRPCRAGGHLPRRRASARDAQRVLRQRRPGGGQDVDHRGVIVRHDGIARLDLRQVADLVAGDDREGVALRPDQRDFPGLRD